MSLESSHQTPPIPANHLQVPPPESTVSLVTARNEIGLAMPDANKLVTKELSKPPTPINADLAAPPTPNKGEIQPTTATAETHPTIDLKLEQILGALPPDKRLIGGKAYKLLMDPSRLNDKNSLVAIESINKLLVADGSKIERQKLEIEECVQKRLKLQEYIDAVNAIRQSESKSDGRLRVPDSQLVNLLPIYNKHIEKMEHLKGFESTAREYLAKLETNALTRAEWRNEIAKKMSDVYEKRLEGPRAKLETLTTKRDQLELDLAAMDYDHAELYEELGKHQENYEKLKSIVEAGGFWSKLSPSNAKMLRERKSAIHTEQNRMQNERASLELRLLEISKRLDTAKATLMPFEQKQREYRKYFEPITSVTDSPEANNTTPEATQEDEAITKESTVAHEASYSKGDQQVSAAEPRLASTLEGKEGKTTVQEVVQTWNQTLPFVRGLSDAEKKKATINLADFLKALQWKGLGELFGRNEVPPNSIMKVDRFMKVAEKFLKVKKVPPGVIKMTMDSFRQANSKK